MLPGDPSALILCTIVRLETLLVFNDARRKGEIGILWVDGPVPSGENLHVHLNVADLGTLGLGKSVEMCSIIGHHVPAQLHVLEHALHLGRVTTAAIGLELRYQCTLGIKADGLIQKQSLGQVALVECLEYILGMNVSEERQDGSLEDLHLRLGSARQADHDRSTSRRAGRIRPRQNRRGTCRSGGGGSATGLGVLEAQINILGKELGDSSSSVTLVIIVPVATSIAYLLEDIADSLGEALVSTKGTNLQIFQMRLAREEVGDNLELGILALGLAGAARGGRTAPAASASYSDDLQSPLATVLSKRRAELIDTTTHTLAEGVQPADVGNNPALIIQQLVQDGGVEDVLPIVMRSDQMQVDNGQEQAHRGRFVLLPGNTTR
mmetsp:Transcript_24933/g.72125  ORF Transcript_24933/g.72125 Transcript_24933/m.72125 type:complete len:380 (+) Transcript_24933:714-1853(+)